MPLIHRNLESFHENPDGSWEAVYGEPEDELDEWPEEIDTEPLTYQGVPIIWDEAE